MLAARGEFQQACATDNQTGSTLKFVLSLVAAASIAVAVGATVRCIHESKRADTAEAKLAEQIKMEKSFMSKLYGACTKPEEIETAAQPQVIGCVGMVAAMAREDGKSESAARAQALGALKTDSTDAARDRVTWVVHQAYTEFAQLNPSQVYGAIYDRRLIAEKFDRAFAQE